LKTYRPLLASESVDTVGEELRWLGQVLSGARDAQVLRERLHELVISQPAELVQGRASQHIDDDLRDAYHDGRKQALQALDTDRYFRLLDALDELVQSPCLTSEANGPVKDVLPRLLARDTRRLRRAVQEITPTDDLQAHDQALHEARKKAKRLRYAAESAVPVFPDRAKHLATTAKQIQEALGEHQDAVVARDKLHEYGAQTQDSGDNGFTLGRLHALEQTRADAAEHKFWAAWRQLPQKKLRKWVRS
jgi:CHAD domain-containing protein